MSLDLCRMSLQQTKELLRLTDSTLQEICCRKFSGEELYLQALQQVLGGKGRRGPAGIFVAFHDRGGELLRGRVFHLQEGAMAERAEIPISQGSAFAVNLRETEFQDDAVVWNLIESSDGLETIHAYFPESINGFVGAPIRNFVTCRVSGDAPGTIVAFNYPGMASEYDGDVLKSLAVVIGSLVTLSNEVRETEQAFIYTIEALARACEAAEEQTGKHIQRVNRYAGALAANLGLPAEFVETISYSAQMHDVGKIRIPTEILLKKGKLTSEEQAVMKLHPAYGKEILGDSPRLTIAREIAISHHENWDGSGYPGGLRHEEIPLAGRIVRVADVYDALRSKRSYKEPLDHETALKVFREGDERVRPRDHFDPLLLATFFRIEHMFARIYESLEA